MKKRDDLNIFYDLIFDSIDDIEKETSFPKYFYTAFLAGENKLYQKNITETKKFEDDWIATLESFFPSIDKILKNPKSTLKYEEEIIAIEKAKKTNSSSIRHLASHTHLIKEIKKDSIIPKKILTQNPETEFEIYENRFIKTLIDRLYMFVNSRYEVIRSNIESFQKNHLNFESKFKFDNADIDMTIDMSIKKDLDDVEINQHNRDLLKRVEYLNGLIGGFKTSVFMKMMERAKPVVPPIMKTNIILKNSDFKNAYTLWLFLDRYTSIGFDVDVQEKNLNIDKSFLKEIYQLGLLTYSTIQFNQRAKHDRFENNDLTQYTRRSTKIAKTNAKDIVENPDAVAIENTAVNEYYLDQNKKVFRKKIDELLADNNYEMALKKAMRETIDITNALYQSVFELEEEEPDVFSKLITNVDLDSDLDLAKNRAKIAKIIRETKEVDYNNSIRLEKKLLKEIESLNTQIIKREKLRLKEEIEAVRKAEIEKNIKILQELKEKAKKNQTIMDKSLEDVSKIKTDMAETQKQTAQKIKATKSTLDQTKKDLIDKEKQKAKLQRQKEIAKIKEKERKAKEREKEKARLAALKAKAKEKARLETLKAKEQKAKKSKSKAKTINSKKDEMTNQQLINLQIDSLVSKARDEKNQSNNDVKISNE